MADAKRAPEALDAPVLALLAATTRALTSYDLVELLAAQGERVQPTQVYRSLDRLIARGKARRIECMRAYAPTAETPDPLVVACTACRAFVDADGNGMRKRLQAHAAARGFVATGMVAEVMALCAACANDAQG